MTPCPYMTVVAGNVRENGFADVWANSSVFADLRDTGNLKGKCGACEFKDLCGGCRCRAFAAFGDYLREDPACAYQPTGRVLETFPLEWTDPALLRLDRIPIAFIQKKVRSGVEAYARQNGHRTVTSDVMGQALAGNARVAAFGQKFS